MGGNGEAPKAAPPGTTVKLVISYNILTQRTEVDGCPEGGPVDVVTNRPLANLMLAEAKCMIHDWHREHGAPVRAEGEPRIWAPKPGLIS